MINLTNEIKNSCKTNLKINNNIFIIDNQELVKCHIETCILIINKTFIAFLNFKNLSIKDYELLLNECFQDFFSTSVILITISRLDYINKIIANYPNQNKLNKYYKAKLIEEFIKLINTDNKELEKCLRKIIIKNTEQIKNEINKEIEKSIKKCKKAINSLSS